MNDTEIEKEIDVAFPGEDYWTFEKSDIKAFIIPLLHQRDEKWRKGVEGLKKKELEDAELQLLDRHEREEYHEQVTGYNQALQDVINLNL